MHCDNSELINGISLPFLKGKKPPSTHHYLHAYHIVMSEMQLTYLVESETLDLRTLHDATKAKGSPFLLSQLQCYLDIGDTVVFSHRVNIPRLPSVKSNVGTILRVEKQTNLDAENILYCCGRNIFPSDM